MVLSAAELAALVPRFGARAVEAAPGLYALRGFTPVEAAAIVALAAASPDWIDAGVNEASAVDKTVRDAQILPEQLNELQARSLRMRLDVVCGRLAAQLAPGATIVECQLVRYHPGGRYVEHRDRPAPNDPRRILSLVCYLNDDISGGATTFPELGVSVQPAAGVVIAFDPWWMHRADPVVDGVKYAITAWYGIAETE
jgi:predicted 2-oxoglutarate/Fe(II)-dependent dioxygenase YbiX